MVKKIFLVLITVLPLFTRAQVNEDEAMAAFLLAEEFYAKSDFISSLGFIEKAKKSFGGGNCKIYYLEVLIRNEIYRTNKNQYEPLMVAIRAFQSSKDIESFNREKIIEIIKLKMLLSQEQEKRTITEADVLKQNEKKLKYFDEIEFDGWPLNVKFNDLMAMKVSHPFFMGKKMTYKVKDHPMVYHMVYNEVIPHGFKINELWFYLYSKTIDSVSVVGVDNGIIRCYQKFTFEKLSTAKDAFTKEQAEQFIVSITDKYSNEFGFSPIKKFIADRTFTIYDYVWKRNEKNFIVRTCLFIVGKRVGVTIYEIISSDLK